MTPATLTRLEKAAVDNGFDQELPRQGEWLGYASTQAPLWVRGLGEGHRAYLAWHRARVFKATG